MPRDEEQHPRRKTSDRVERLVHTGRWPFYVACQTRHAPWRELILAGLLRNQPGRAVWKAGQDPERFQ